MNFPLFQKLPDVGVKFDSGLLLDRFLEYVTDKGVDLYPAQEEAILALFEKENVILNTPTGSGKSLVATALHFYSLAHGRRSIYTCPIKALVNEKFLALCADFGPDQVGMVTGDASVNPHAPILCCTAEILSNIALRDGAEAPVEDIIMDEFHYYADQERGVAWQIPLLTLPKSRFLLMSATFGDTDLFEKTLNSLTGRPTAVVRSVDRPVPLDFIYQETPLHETLRELMLRSRYPVYLVNFTQREAAEQAQSLLSVDYSTKEEKQAIATAIEGTRFTSPFGKEIHKLLRHGIGLHHAGLLPKYRILVERLAQRGLLKVISGTDTLGVGVNIPIRTVLFTKLCKYDGTKTTILSVRDFQQISGRAGRKGFDDQGTVVVQAPEHVIENKMLEFKAGSDPKKLRKIVKRKPPEKGYLHWDQNTFNRLTTSPAEPLTSRFQVTHGMLLNILSRPEDGCRAMKALIRDSHETPAAKRQWTRTAFQLFRSLIDRKIIQFLPKNSESQRKLQVNVDLQADFSLNQTLSLYLLDTIKLIDPYSESYALDVLTVVEAILENPDLILRKQLDRLKTLKMSEMKMAGIEYDERIAELEKLEYPKPNREFIYDTFNHFAAAHPWVGTENIRPKSISREMYETFQTFDEYIRDYDLQRAEGLLLRYASETYKVLIQTVPESCRNEEIESMIAYFSSMVRQVDSSLLDEWEKLRNPEAQTTTTAAAAAAADADANSRPFDITRDKKAFNILVRNEVFRVIRALSSKDYEGVLSIIDAQKIGTGDPWNAKEVEALMKPYYEDHQYILTDRKARLSEHIKISNAPDEQAIRILQTLIDPDDFNDWTVDLQINLPRTKEAGRVVLQLAALGVI
jgi:superfamily II RNA helicase